jgi:hypothetical protein
VSRKPSGMLIRNRQGWSARYWATVDGVRLRVTKQLDTDNERVAKAKLKTILESENPGAFDGGTPETFEQAAQRVHEARVTAGIGAAGDELTRLRSFAFPERSARPSPSPRRTSTQRSTECATQASAGRPAHTRCRPSA